MGQMIPAFESRRLDPGKTVPGAYFEQIQFFSLAWL